MDSYMDRYVGEWENDAGNRLSIRKVDDETCFVSFYHAYDNQPIRRPWSAGKPSVEMIAKCKTTDGPELIVQLGEEGTGFSYETNRVTFIDKSNNIDKFELKSKQYVAEDILDKVESLIDIKG